MDPILKRQLNNLAAEDDDIDEMAEGSNWVDIDAVMEGSERIELSHAGGELQDSLAEGIEEEISVNRRWDWRTRRDRTERRNLDFMAQMPEMILVYMRWCDPEEGGSPISDTDEDTEVYSILVIDMFDTERREIALDPRGGGISPALIMQGLVPCSPWKPTAAITTRVLEVYRVAHARCPQLAIQAFVKTLCDLHGVPYRPYLREQFSISYDLYLDLRRRTEARLLHHLGRDSFAWRVKHDCPACMYKLEGEDELIFDVLVTQDGGNSLKRVLQRNKVESEPGDGPEFVVGESKEYTDNRDASDWYFLAREKVNELAKHRIAERMPMEAIEDKTNPCAERWKNMIEDVTAKMWGIFDETGIFVCLCRHGFVLMIVDMIKSGELAKYPLAVTEALLEHLGERTGAGYDVGCDFQTTLKNSPLGECAKCKNFCCLVGAFHGHAHNRLCQLCFLATYVEGLGLEDLEGCERFFSGSNGLAKSCRYASRFHRQQEIMAYVKHYDTFHTYANLSKFLSDNYKQALGILKTEHKIRQFMAKEEIANYQVLHDWLKEEKAFLLGLQEESKDQTETLEMEYVQKLVNLDTSRFSSAKYVVLATEARKAQGNNATYTPGTSKAELARRRGKEKVEHDLEAVQELEERLGIVDRWTTESEKWQSTVGEIKKRKYQLALNSVEHLIVQRIFELTKVNQSQTGYKMRRHIAKSLQARSKAVKNAIDRYNDAALALDPPMVSLTWEQVVEYTFLADFDILRDTRDELCRAREEIQRLNIEIRRVVTWIRDENRFLLDQEESLRSEEGKSPEDAETDRLLAVQVKLYRERRGRFDRTHIQRFQKLAHLNGFTGTIRSGTAVERAGSEVSMIGIDGDRDLDDGAA
ncbi:hypothetical protein DFH08DRAFT_916509 [Mycena albidolilacea]|uniref:CxC1-like cysteine cluster associated with KDZ transposases domain-containing protein n=1 Tax=Mycena albidolilacea TaxID=1033008 RepID=A0AAD6ZN61_9AGAR|nr:hypothetical protein DFH08DRAFT_916509 [Mycena albidolilacea]